MVGVDRDRLLDRLRAVVAPASLITAGPALKPYETDGLTAVRETPGVVVLPENVVQLAEIVAVCRELSVPLVPRGAGTGLSGGARPLRDGVLLGLSKLNRILRIDPDNRVAVVEPGVANLAISEAAAAHGLYTLPDTQELRQLGRQHQPLRRQLDRPERGVDHATELRSCLKARDPDLPRPVAEPESCRDRA